ncbi:pyruvate dehydrogenase E2 component (dihydrolipoamide acetyltransferase) [Cryobacterium mesophilum]|uniref:Dihydrolipoamide acetyltransferase component of pyruvate dehydrogenase complex n=1 Tax=Terrimesophilobacter mesophilus TaxID=433647 RepID=A0A4R8VDF0_9MICO|nr:dihydrolipoamide acetyltransferase family protein [Terrimesophilobacter mesophilus]MBB5634056.1 pyruvate dehydrogenase E2 component (dihydrolipoamide acetyltransferase) [Terrimesophilobacter mesophilus]TFB81401.1 2-oxo acid dehydrogenase subunit E2 [Terrimesophilobacter mesophilus]
MASRDFILPDLGEGLTEAEIVNWLVAEGDTVVVDQPIIEVESAKSIVELPCPFAGVVEKLHAAVGDTIHTGQAVVTVAVEGGATDAAAAPSGDAAPGRRAVPSGRFGRRGLIEEPRETAEVRGMAATAPSPSPRRRDDAAGRSPVVSPLVRRLARDHGFAAHSIAGSGQGGLVLRSDVERRIAENGAATARASAATAQPAAIASAAGDIRIPITGLRKVVAERMAASRREVPEATIWLDVDATELLEAKEQLQRSTGERWSLNALLARFVVAGLKQWPILNSSVDMAAGEIVQHSAINLGVAAQTGRGLMVPVIHGAGELTTEGLRDALTTLVETAKTGNFPNDQLRGGTFTLNNYGGFGMDGSAPIINQPEVAMLGVGRILDRPWVVDGQIVVRKIMVLSMVFDHRVCDGDIPSEFMAFMTRCVQNPIALLGGL